MVALGFPGLDWQVTDKFSPSVIFCWDSVFTVGGSSLKKNQTLMYYEQVYSKFWDWDYDIYAKFA